MRAGQIKARDASLLFVVGEENAGDGMLTANSLGPRWETVIFGEPTELKLVSGREFTPFYLIFSVMLVKSLKSMDVQKSFQRL